MGGVPYKSAKKRVDVLSLSVSAFHYKRAPILMPSKQETITYSRTASSFEVKS